MSGLLNMSLDKNTSSTHDTKKTKTWSRKTKNLFTGFSLSCFTGQEEDKKGGVYFTDFMSRNLKKQSTLKKNKEIFTKNQLLTSLPLHCFIEFYSLVFGEGCSTDRLCFTLLFRFSQSHHVLTEERKKTCLMLCLQELISSSSLSLFFFLLEVLLQYLNFCFN
jgi:hypothetical protein